MTLDEFLDKLDGVRPAGTGYVGVCPAHDDREASLGVTEGDNGLLCKCHAGCETSDVLSALGLTWSDLFFNSIGQDEPEVTYDYTDEQGNLLFQSVRFPGKKFRQRHKGEDGEWVGNLDGVRRVLYRLPEVIAAVKAGETVGICEGEKDVEALRDVGVTATCNPMGAGKWRDEYTEFLRGANVIIIADRDEPGRAHARTVEKALMGTGPQDRVAASCVVVQAKRGKDAHDHLVKHGLSKGEFVPLRQPVRRGIVTARELAEQGLEDLETSESDIPGYILIDAVPIKFRQGRMYAWGAYTGDGKTTGALQGTRKLAEEARRVAYFTLEMPERDLKNKLASHKGIALELLEEPWRLRMDAVKYQVYLDAMQEIAEWNLDIIFDSRMTAEKVAEIVKDREADVAVIDHVHRFAWGDRRKLEEQVQSLTNLALEQNVMLLILCQLRKHQRGKDLEAYPCPGLQDFRETSQIADDASLALATWRQRDASGLTYTGATQVIVLKNRHTTGANDEAGRIFMPAFDTERQLFVARPPATLIPLTGAA